MSTAPVFKLTAEHINDQVIAAQYHQFPGTTVTVCCLTLRNGFNVVGHSACVSPETFDKDTGIKLAFGDAYEKIWQLEGYALREFIHANEAEWAALAANNHAVTDADA